MTTHTTIVTLLDAVSKKLSTAATELRKEAAEINNTTAYPYKVNLQKLASMYNKKRKQ